MSIDSLSPPDPIVTQIPSSARIQCDPGGSDVLAERGRILVIRQAGDSFAVLFPNGVDTFIVVHMTTSNVLSGRMASPYYVGALFNATRHAGADPNKLPFYFLFGPEFPDGEVGDSVRMLTTVQDAYDLDIQNPDIRWSSSAPTVATIRSDGVLIGVAPGTTTITGTIDTLIRSATFTVLTPPASIAIVAAPDSLIDPTNAYVQAVARDAGGQVLPGRRFRWSSSNTAVATVADAGDQGSVQTTGPGTVTITARSAGLTAAVTFPVLPAVATIDVGGVPPGGVITIGNTAQLSATPRDAGGNALSGRPASWAVDVSQDAIFQPFQVSPTGLVTAHRGGPGKVIVQVGDSTRALDLVAVMDGRFTGLAAGDGHTCGLTTTGRVYCWGTDLEGRLGPLTEAGPGALPIPGTFVAVEAGPSHSCALNGSGAAFCWGRNDDGQLGQLGGAVGEVQTVSGGHAFAQISVGDLFTCGVTAAHDAYCWGGNEGGQLGGGATGTGANASPGLVVGSHAFTQVQAGSGHACALTTIGEAWCWGANWGGQLGLGTMDGNAHPTPVHGAPGLTFSELAAGGGRTCGITAGGHVTCWGAFKATPTEVPGVSGIVRLTGGDPGFCGLDAAGTMSCWDEPVETSLFTPNVPIAEFTASAHHICVLPVTGKAECWGSNGVYQLGVQDPIYEYTPVEIIGQP
jgi:hypothetical protein